MPIFFLVIFLCCLFWNLQGISGFKMALSLKVSITFLDINLRYLVTLHTDGVARPSVRSTVVSGV